MKLRRIAPTFVVLFLLAGAAALLGGCAKAAAPAAQPSTSAAPEAAVAAPTLQLVAPADAATVKAGTVNVSVTTTGLKFVTPSTTIVAGEGHVHFTLDSEPFQMSDSPEFTYKDVAPGPHTLVAELVRNDATSFSPPVKQQVTFTAK